jgi:phospholipid transport system substrate-binding protein
MLRIAFIALCLTTFIALPAVAAGGRGMDTPATQFVQKLGDKALTSLTAKEIAPAERSRRVRDLLRSNFDIKTIGRFALGPSWRTATEAQKNEYFNLFEQMIVSTYTDRFQEYSGQSFKVLGSSASGKEGNDWVVNSQILQKDGPPVAVGWVVRDKGAGLRIVDVTVEGISMSVTQRNDFGAVIQSGGGKIDALLASLRKRTNGGKKG